MQGSGSSNQNTLRTSTNPYARPTPGHYYRCGKTGYRSNVYLECISVNLVEDVVDEGEESSKMKIMDYNEAKAEYGQKDGERVSYIVQKVLCAAPQPY